MNNSKTAIIISQIVEKIQLIAGIVIVVFFGLMTIAGMMDESIRSDTFVTGVFIFIDVLGILLIYFSRKRKKLILDFKKYVSVISGDPTGSIANIASAVGTSEDVVRKNLDLMIRHKYFANAHINYEMNRIVIASAQGGEPRSEKQTDASAACGEQAAAPKEIEYITVTCKSCGGVNKIKKGQVCECDYCGSPIKG